MIAPAMAGTYAALAVAACLALLSLECRMRFGMWLEPRTFHIGNIAAWGTLWAAVALHIWIAPHIWLALTA
jgi:hypothetical protein